MHRLLKPLLTVGLTLVVAAVLLGVAAAQGWLSPFGIQATNRDSQVIQTIEETQEVSLLALGIQGINEQEQCQEAFGKCIPGATEKLFIQYNFTAKLGLDGGEVSVDETSAGAYTITVPEFTFIGYDQPTFKEAAADGGLLSWVTPDVDALDMVNKILSEDAQSQYVDAHREMLEDQARFFYDSLIKSVDPDATTAYEFSS